MDIKPIRSEADYDAALDEIARLMDRTPPLGSDDADRLDVLATLVEAYEAKTHPVDPPDPWSDLLGERNTTGVEDAI